MENQYLETLDFLIKSMELNLKGLKLLSDHLKSGQSQNIQIARDCVEQVKQNVDPVKQVIHLKKHLEQDPGCRENNLFNFDETNNISNESECKSLWNRRMNLHQNAKSKLELDLSPDLAPELNSRPKVGAELRLESEQESPLLKINPLLRLKQSERENLLYGFYKTAKFNVVNILRIPEDSEIFDKNLQEESDRLIQDWIQFQYKN